MTKFTDNRFMRFIIVGGFNTLLTYLVYLVLVCFVDYRVAFSLSFALGILIAYALNSKVVFGVSFTWRSLARYPLLYLIQYGVGLLLLDLEVQRMGLDRRIAPLLNVLILLPFTFLLNKWFLAGKAKS